MKRPFTTKDDPQTNFWSVADPEIQHAALKSKGMRTDRMGGDPESSAKKSRSGEFHRRHLIARSSRRSHQLSSDERRVGTACVSTSGSRGPTMNKKKNKNR